MLWWLLNLRTQKHGWVDEQGSWWFHWTTCHSMPDGWVNASQLSAGSCNFELSKSKSPLYILVHPYQLAVLSRIYIMNHSTDSPYQELERQMMQQQAETHALASGMMDDPRRLETMSLPNPLPVSNPARPTAPMPPPPRYLASTVSSRARRSPTPQSLQTRQPVSPHRGQIE